MISPIVREMFKPMISPIVREMFKPHHPLAPPRCDFYQRGAVRAPTFNIRIRQADEPATEGEA